MSHVWSVPNAFEVLPHKSFSVDPVSEYKIVTFVSITAAVVASVVASVTVTTASVVTSAVVASVVPMVASAADSTV